MNSFATKQRSGLPGMAIRNAGRACGKNLNKELQGLSILIQTVLPVSNATPVFFARSETFFVGWGSLQELAAFCKAADLYRQAFASGKTALYLLDRIDSIA